ncbi:esterase ybfF [Vibrio astriarenae]|nr:esterase ybfF [Vibrio sp. C7]
MDKLLNYKIQGNGEPLLLIHGLFGSLDNLGLLARGLQERYQVISVDLRNHGRSFHSKDHSYANMADDISALLDHLGIHQCIVVGHSMGGKVAMKLASTQPERVKQLVVMDMSPVAYQTHRHDNVFSGLQPSMSSVQNLEKKRWWFFNNISRLMAYGSFSRNRCTPKMALYAGDSMSIHY